MKKPVNVKPDSESSAKTRRKIREQLEQAGVGNDQAPQPAHRAGEDQPDGEPDLSVSEVQSGGTLRQKALSGDRKKKQADYPDDATEVEKQKDAGE